MSKENKAKIAIIGGGIAGASVALYLSEFPLEITLFEKNSSLVSGPPMCHLHAGGNLYREIDDAQCIKLLKQSIELLRFYPHAIDFRPTVIAIPTTDTGEPCELFSRLEKLQKEYASLIQKDESNKVLGESEEYYKLFGKEEVEKLREETVKKHPETLDDWLIPIAKNLDLTKIKFPLILVQEYGLNVFRIAANSSLALQKKENVTLKTNTFVKEIIKKKDSFIIENERFDYLINAAGFQSGVIDDMLGIKRERLVEFKAAYVTKWETNETVWPEIIFYGKRGTPNGMAQFTPYPNGYFQLHGMTKEITLFEDGLAKSSKLSAQPKLESKFIEKIDKGWKFSVTKERTTRAIEHISKFMPAFKASKVASKPLYGAQQIPGDDATLRASEVSFEGERYARCEIVKASSILTMADAITKKLIDLNILDKEMYGKRDFSTAKKIESETITNYAEKLCLEREYPKSLASVNYGVRERI
ncbi:MULTISPECIES: FAD-dependent oxidoreductase [Sulfurimonas]|uniref:FAD-dependent oxidoreductase n=1 Tax=Sulfurimonas TaxID=202746 RepID=UPI00126498B3|nr:FAD-dependent oxidoreductase [Sulfurimonas indica]